MKKVAIVGVEGSGKTVLMSAMGDKYKSPDSNGYFMLPQNHETFAFYTRESDRMRNGMWPIATGIETFRRLDWCLMRKKSERFAPEHICEITFADFAGEIYRIAFGNGNHGDITTELEPCIRQVKEHVFNSVALIVLVNLADVINGSHSDARTIEMLWLTQDMLRQANKNGKQRKIALVFTQADAYSETITACGGLRGVLSKYLPQVYAGYSNKISLFAVSAVSKTIPASDGSGFPVPAANFTPEGLDQIIKWVVTSVTSGYSRRHFVLSTGLCLCLVCLASGAYLWHKTKEGNRLRDEASRLQEQVTHKFLAAVEGKRYQEAAVYIDMINSDAPNVQIALGDMYKNGHGVKRDKKLAVQYYMLAAEGGNAEAQRLLGDCYSYGGYGIEQDTNEGFKWYLKSADNGDVKAQRIVGREYCTEHFKALCAYRLAQLKKKDTRSLHAEVKRLEDRATDYLLLAIENGDITANSLLGDMFFQSAKLDWWGDDEYDISRDVYKQAEDYYFVAATNGYQFAQRRLGEIFAKGLSGKKDIEQAKKWYKMAADQGDDEAIQALKQFK